jgi:hypothetical protein
MSLSEKAQTLAYARRYLDVEAAVDGVDSDDETSEHESDQGT